MILLIDSVALSIAAVCVMITVLGLAVARRRGTFEASVRHHQFSGDVAFTGRAPEEESARRITPADETRLSQCSATQD